MGNAFGVIEKSSWGCITEGSPSSTEDMHGGMKLAGSVFLHW